MLPPICLVGSVAWCAVVPLICFHVVEWHQPDRVLRQYGVDYDEVFAPIALMETIRLLISLAAQMKWRIFQLDVKSAFQMAILKKMSMLNNQWVLSSKVKKEKS